MKDLFSHLVMARPLLLLLLLLLPLLWLRLKGRSLAVILWRSAILVLLVAALADPQRVGETRKEGERIFAFDLSRSVPPAMRAWMEKSAREGFAPAAGERAFVFGAAARQADDWERWVRGEAAQGAVRPEQTNLESLFAELLRLPPAARNLYLFTDGWETQGSLERIIPSLSASGLKVFPVLPPEPPAVANVAVRKVLAPHQGTSGEGINLKVVVENQQGREVEGSLVIKRNGQPIKSETVRLKPGSHILSYPSTLSQGPLESFTASFAPSVAAADAFPPDNQATSWVAVQTREKALLLNGRSGEGKYLEELLKRRGFEVASVTAPAPPPAPDGYGIIIFNNIQRERFSAEYLAALERQVAAGKAFIMLGGEASFGPGGYRHTPVEKLLPVDLKEPKKEEKNRALVLVIDKSGSMRDESRMAYAKEAAKAVVGQLKNNDFLGVVAFDSSPFVVVPLTQVEKLRGTVAGQIDRLNASGRTYLMPAILEAKRQLERQSAGRKHVIILSDGDTGGSGSDYVDLVTVMRDELKIIVSAIAIGNEANIPLMKRIAQYGGGIFYHTFQASRLPQILLDQVKDKPEEAPLVEKEFRPILARGSELLAGFPSGSYPPLRGYVETELKKEGHLDLVIPRDGARAPLLASWRYGKGKAIVFASDLSGRWSKDWIQWEALERFWGRIFEWLRPLKESLPPHEVRINLQGDRAVMDLYLYGDESAGSQFRYAITGDSGRTEGSLRRLAPGRYQTSLPITAPGDYRIELIEERGQRRLAYPPLGYSLPYDPRTEIPQAAFNLPLLERLAQMTGGTINPGAQERLRPDEVVQTSQSVKSPLIFLAFVLFLLEIILRRFVFRTAG